MGGDHLNRSDDWLHGWVRQAECDQGLRAGTTTAKAERIKALEREVRELRQANEILRKTFLRMMQDP